ncbi:hypothetical protein [uncultured Treponema sp.]|uniref:hypothetical protein n=1 Tax=uncultured Treponema sp. TaxID=162155 RepID=UPI00259A788C|nr:hypothetical protein [uncultured Treponema sp.]
MKKIIIFALAALLCSFSLAGCSGDSEDGVPGKGVWQKKTVNYTARNADGTGDDTTILEVYLYYSDEAYTQNLRSGVTIDPGLTVIITASSDSKTTQLAQQLIGNKYVMKHYEKGVSLNDDTAEDVEDKDSIFKMTVGDGSWRVIYTALLVSGNTVAQTETPEPIRKGKDYSQIAYDAEEIKNNLSWKRLLIALLES